MPPHSKSRDPRHRRLPQESGDSLPLLPMRHGLRNTSVWNDDHDDKERGSTSLPQRKSEDSFYDFLEDEEDESTLLNESTEKMAITNALHRKAASQTFGGQILVLTRSEIY